MIQKCISCTKEFDKLKDSNCKACYELAILKGQCLKVAATLLAPYINPDHPDIGIKLLDLTKRIFEDAKNQKFPELK